MASMSRLKSRYRAVLWLALSLSQAAWGVCGDAWDSPHLCCGSFEGIAELLYLSTTGCETPYLLSDKRSISAANEFGTLALPTGHSRTNQLGYNPGFRIGIGYLFHGRCDELELSFAGLWASEDERRTPPLGGGLWAIIGQPRYLSNRLNDPVQVGAQELGIAAHGAAKTRIGYEQVDCIGARRFALDCGFWMRALLGVRWVRLRDRRDLLYEGTAVLSDGANPVVQMQWHAVRERDESEAVGPLVGGRMRYTFGCGLGFSACTNIGVLVGQRKARIQQLSQGITVPTAGNDDFNEIMNLSYRSRCSGFPCIEGKLGASYLRCCGRCHSLLITMGYQWSAHLNAVARLRFNDVGGTERPACQNFNLHGLFITFDLMI
jgi:hypothetical protein